MKRRFGLMFFAFILILSLGLAGCNNESGGKKTGGESGSDGDSSSGGTLVFGRGGDSTSLDPAVTTEGEAFKVTKNIYETLIEFGEQDTEIHRALLKAGKSLKVV
ncbi:dipeptide-binding ABC transporter [Mesobacillus boroniphilus JCM 21738]|uniref:Dipeptide-binding ABC transporter n=1 Tax=Mesobacillus boroniphilus JCM 21738 TaxID=1294265 RepID=W4RQR5_9BACI|nr:dipeptide-binding ABC transporter [Mesobacillus boroniphilus JCM 21738]